MTGRDRSVEEELSSSFEPCLKGNRNCSVSSTQRGRLISDLMYGVARLLGCYSAKSEVYTRTKFSFVNLLSVRLYE